MIAVVTALLGPAEAPPPRGPEEYGVTYHCYTDRAAPGWECRPPPVSGTRRAARYVKTHVHELLPVEPGDWSIWVDASFDLKVKPSAIIAAAEATGCDVAAFCHPDRDTVDAEADEVMRLGMAEVRAVRKQLADMRFAGFDTGVPRRLTTTGLLVRRHCEAVARFNSLWWGEITSGTLRDQLSVDYAAFRAGIRIGHLPGDYRANRFAHYQRARHRLGRVPA